MSGTIAVRGTGKVSVPPDNIIISVTLSAEDKEYSAAMDKASAMIESLRSRIAKAGFSGSDLKTSYFNVRTEYDSVQDEHGRYTNIFRAYNCVHSMKLEFDLDLDRLNRALTAFSAGEAAPELSISFTVKDEEAVNSELLRNVAENAREKAETLCAASGKKLGELIKIEYNWDDHSFVSPTRCEMNDCAPRMLGAAMKSVSIVPDNIQLSDTAAFIWNME
jgi:hypothetical protein